MVAASSACQFARCPCTSSRTADGDTTVNARLDTVVIEPDAHRFSLAWRAVIDMPRSLFDVQEAIVGEMPPAWHRARRFPGKTYYRNLAELVQARRRPSA